MNIVGSKKEKSVLVLDIGTSFVKIGLFDLEANPLKDYQIKFEHWMTIKSDGTYIFDAETSAELIKELIGEEVNSSSIAAIVEDQAKLNKERKDVV